MATITAVAASVSTTTDATITAADAKALSGFSYFFAAAATTETTAAANL